MQVNKSSNQNKVLDKSNKMLQKAYQVNINKLALLFKLDFDGFTEMLFETEVFRH